MEFNKDQLISDLQQGTVVVTFTKATGEERIMTCTLNESLLPPVKENSATKRKPNPDVCVVWDTNANGWRSFRYDRVKSVTAAV
jgi:hypothetical protein